MPKQSPFPAALAVLRPAILFLVLPFHTMPLQHRRDPFDHPDWLFELKYDGLRALAVIQAGHRRLVSRNGHPFISLQLDECDVERVQDVGEAYSGCDSSTHASE
jgi:ATP-dependent DNA ligase